ncbi:MAG: ABC transporter permease [Chthoniobacterales bacterium]|nr:ABC transporter permease [Chthoniobacterales bacterium]
MTPPLYIALRFLLHRKRAFLLSLCGVVFGVAIFICSQAQTEGFARQFINSTLGSNGALVLRSRFQPLGSGLPVPPKKSAVPGNNTQRRYLEGITNPREIMRVSRQFSNVAACSPVLRGTLSARSGFENATVDLFGIDAALHLQTTDLKKQLIAGDFENFRNDASSVIVGSRLAQELNLAAGDSVQLLSPGGEYWRFTVAAIARSGVGAVDAARIYSHPKIAQTLLRRPFAASMIIYKLRDPARAPALASQFEGLFQHDAQSWQEREAGNLQLFMTLRISAGITVSLIILLAGFGIFNVLTMSVLAKVKEIAILRSMGYRRSDISSIFLWQGAMIAVVGALLGCVTGAVLTWGVSKIPIRVRGLIVTDHFLVAWNWQHYFWAMVLAALAVFIASYVPARRAAYLAPVATLRGSSV